MAGRQGADLPAVLPFVNVTDIHDLTAAEQASAVRRRELSPLEIIDHYLERIDRLGRQVGAFFTVTPDAARDQARKAEAIAAEAVEPAEAQPLLGLPVPIKDLNMLAGVRLTYGSAVFADNVAARDDHVTSALRAAGAVFPGKTACPEFGLPCYSEGAVGPPARTPWDLNRSAGGSSGGAAAAVAAGLAPVAQGSDGGGSIRIPSSVCGLFGIKPSRGRISQAPLVPDLAGLSTDGPIARTVADAAMLLDVMAGNRPGDMYTQPPLPGGETFSSYAVRDPGRLRIARVIDPVVPGAEVHPDCRAAWEDASALLESLGHEVEDLPSPTGPDVVPHFVTLWYAMATLTPVGPEQEDQLQPLTRYLRDRGRATSAADLIRAQAYLQIMMRSVLPVTNNYDAILSPTLAQLPAPVGYFRDAEPAENFERQTRFTPFTAVYNVSGQPAVNVPLYWNAGGLPVGIMLAGRMGEEGTLISLSAQLESARPWRDRHPALW
jgi:amidase